MKLSNGIIYTILSMSAAMTVRGQQADSLKARLAVLTVQYRSHHLSDSNYLHSVDSLAPFLVQEDSLPQWLSVYRDIVFANPRPDKHKASYYTYMALNAYNVRKLGSAIFYSEKNNEERINVGLFEKGGIPHSDMFATIVYYNNHDYTRLLQKYQQVLPALDSMPGEVTAGRVSLEQVFVGLSIIQAAVYTYYKKNDTVHMEEAAKLAQGILDKMRQRPDKYGSARKQFDYLGHSIAYKERSAGHPEEAAGLLYQAIEDVADTAFPEGMRADYSNGLYDDAIEFYSGRHKPDSVRHYLQLLQGIGKFARESTTDMVFLNANKAYLLGDEGHYADAYLELKKAFELRDSAYYSVSADKENNLYALAEADNAHAEMERAQEKKRHAEQANLYLYFLLSLLVVAGAALFIVNRDRQRQRLLGLQISLARNFHDDIGPMLIYANALVKKELDEHPSDRLSELKTHIGAIMDEVRGISHDLKTTALGTVADLVRENTSLLERLKDATGTGFTMKTENADRPLSHVQYTHLVKITRELIGNSIKHAECQKIHVEMKAVGQQLLLHYSDDGKGIDPAIPPAGIGLQNIQERVSGLQGVFQLNNSWPRGYSIQISIPLI